MAHRQRFGALVAALFATLMGAATAQAPASRTTGSLAASGTQASRLAGDWRSSAPVAIPASKPPLPQDATDLGPADAGARLDRVLLLLEPSAAQKQALDAELAQQQDPKSSEYHHWLTPSQFADAFANSPTDAAAIVSWLQSEGFDVGPLPSGRAWIDFSGTVAQLEQAFQTRVHSVSTRGGPRLALSDSIAVPAAFVPLIHGLVSLDGAIASPAVTAAQPVASPVADLAALRSRSQAEALTPQLAAQLLHLDSLHASGSNGGGETIAIAARSNVQKQDVAAFRTAFGLPADPLQVALAGSDPGRTGDEAEAVLSASWAGAAAPQAHIVLAPASTTTATDGLDLSLAAIVDRPLAPVVAVGFSSCEASLSEAHQAFYAALYRQAAAEGISIIAATGDSGASACDQAGRDGATASGYGVNALASTPWNTAVGTAAVADGAEATATATAPTSSGNALVGWSPRNPADPAYAGGGGGSALYSAPAWQPLPATNLTGAAPGHYARLMPDLALPTAIDSGPNRGLVFCLAGGTGSNSAVCHPVRTGGSAAATALFAGIAALIDEQNGPQGNLAPQLYQLSRRSGVFDDVQQGSARLFCAPGSPNCDATGQIGFSAAPGYDLATGLGSIDAQKLVSEWATPEIANGAPVTVNISVSPQIGTYNPTAQITLSANVIPPSGGPTPTGTVYFAYSSVTLNPSGSTLDGNGNASYTFTTGLASGTNNVVATYSGDGTYKSGQSQVLVLTSQPSSTSVNIVPSATTLTVGAPFTVTATVSVGSPPQGTVAPGGTVILTVDGVTAATAPITISNGSITATFSSVTITAAGNHNLLGKYSGDTNYGSSYSPTVQVSLGKSTTVTAISAPGNLTAGVPFAVTATVTVSSSTQGNAAPTGNVTLTVDGVTTASAALNTSDGTATFSSVTITASGNHNLQATYSGDANYSSSVSQSVTVSLGKGATVTALTATPATLTAGVNETFTATISPANAGAGTAPAITGTVSFYDGTTLLNTVGVNGNTATLGNVKLTPFVAHVITAVYSGDNSWAASTSNAITLQLVLLPDTVTLTVNINTTGPGQVVSLVATVTPVTAPPSNIEQNPTGNIIFYNGATVLGTVPLTASLNYASTATLITGSLPAGQDVLTALYVGDQYYEPGTSNTVTVNVQDFTLTPSSGNPPTNLNIVKGSSGAASFVVAGLGGFSDQVQVICVVPTQDYMNCETSPKQVTPPATVIFTVQTFAAGGATTAADRHTSFWPRAGGSAALAILVCFVLPFGRRARALTQRAQRLLVLLLLLAGLGGMGIGCSTAVTVPPQGTGTPLGVATLAITAAAYVDKTVVSHSVYLTVNVLPPGSTANVQPSTHAR